MVITPPCQGRNGGSIPLTRSNVSFYFKRHFFSSNIRKMSIYDLRLSKTFFIWESFLIKFLLNHQTTIFGSNCVALSVMVTLLKLR